MWRDAAGKQTPRGHLQTEGNEAGSSFIINYVAPSYKTMVARARVKLCSFGDQGLQARGALSCVVIIVA